VDDSIVTMIATACSLSWTPMLPTEYPLKWSVPKVKRRLSLLFLALVLTVGVPTLASACVDSGMYTHFDVNDTGFVTVGSAVFSNSGQWNAHVWFDSGSAALYLRVVDSTNGQVMIGPGYVDSSVGWMDIGTLVPCRGYQFQVKSASFWTRAAGYLEVNPK
jgi:hypothetical protein